MCRAVLSLFVFTAFAAASFVVHNDNSSFYRWAIHEPAADIAKPWPLLIFLPGSGTRTDTTDSDDIDAIAGYDGFGRLLAEYDAGNRSAAHTLVAEQFLAVVVVSRLTWNGTTLSHYMPEELIKVVDDVKATYDVDDKIILTGYSMGSRGTWRFATAYPSLITAALPAAGAAEKAGDYYIGLQPIEPDFPLLPRLADVPVWMFASEADTVDTLGNGPNRTAECLQVLQEAGNTKSKRTVYRESENIQHYSTSATATDVMSYVPFIDARSAQWLLDQRAAAQAHSRA